MTDFRSILTMALVFAGVVLLCAALVPVRAILGMLQTGPLRRGWMALSALIALFIPGYMTFWLVHFGAPVRHVDVIVSMILFSGACFVVGVVKLSRQTTQDILRIAKLEQDAFVDPLTGLYNRRYLGMRLDEEIARARRYGFGLGALMIDIDHFKRVNDTYGHQVGDRVLRRIGEIVKSGARSSDIVCRYGGKELLVIVPNTEPAEADKFAERLRETIEATPVATGEDASVSVTVSIGTSALLAADNAQEFLARADRALYRAKSAGRNRVN
jgi:diguanylate cyclase (GGDEF)-like protein